jgi:hypothetical protein
MTEMALYPRADGLLEPRADKSVAWIKEQAKVGRLIVVDVAIDTRSSLQNRYLNGWIYSKQVCKKLHESGITMPGGMQWTRDSFHAAMQDCFLVKHEYLFQGKHIKVYESTADMSKKRFSEYCQQVTEFVYSAWEIRVEDPRENYWAEILKEIRK